MTDTIISVERLSKKYRLGQIGATTLRDSVENWLARMRGARRSREVAESIRQPCSLEDKLSSCQVAQFNQQPNNPTTNNLTTDDAELWALRDVSFEVKRGEVLGIIGRNGAGKSTLLKILSRITEPTSGRAIMRGRVASLLEVGTGFHPELTGRENIYLNGAILGMRHREITAKFDEIVAFSEVERFIDTPVKRYSSGMYVRLAFAVAAHLDPEILLVDEVLAVGDASFQKKCLGKMEDVAKHGRTVLFVSHNMIAVQSLCNRCIWFDCGIKRGDGRQEEIISGYLREGSEAVMQKNWTDKTQDAPGCDALRIFSIKVINEDGTIPDQLEMTKPFIIQTVYEQFDDAQFHIVYYFADEKGIGAFTTGNAEELKTSGLGMCAGRYKCQCHVPANLLNAGSYFLNCYIIRDRSQAEWHQEGLFMFTINDRSVRDVGYQAREPGVVHPKLDWDVQIEPLEYRGVENKLWTCRE